MKNLKTRSLLLLFGVLITSQSFAINDDDNEPCLSVSKVKVIVIGADENHEKNSRGESTWIGKYRDYLQSFNSDNEVINLTKKSFNSYHIMPTGNPVPYRRPHSNPENNITQAISLNPDAILINLEYNDVLAGYKANEEIINIMLLTSKANKSNIPVWINMPKPRSFDSLAYQKTYIKTKNLIKERFGSFVVDYWGDMAEEDGSIQDVYAYNGIHINNKGQELILQKLIEADIHHYCARKKFKGEKDLALYSLNALENGLSADNTKKFEVTLANAGINVRQNIPVVLKAINLETNKNYALSKTIYGGIKNCQFKSIPFTFEDLPKGNYKVMAYISKRIDGNAQNDSTTLSYKHMAALEEKSESILDNRATLNAIYIDGYSIAFNKTDNTEGYRYSNSLEARVYKMGNLFKENNKEGNVIKIVAEKDIQIGGFGITINKPGAKLIEIYSKRNLNPQKDKSLEYWRLISSEEVVVESDNKKIEISIEDFKLKRDSSVGIYIRTKNISGLSTSSNK